MQKLLEKISKLSLPAVILIASLVLGGFYYASQVNKQKSIERQQQIKLEAEAEENERDYIAKRKKECLDIYKVESDKYVGYVQGWKYPASNALGRLAGEKGDSCEIIYKNSKTGENFSKFY